MTQNQFGLEDPTIDGWATSNERGQGAYDAAESPVSHKIDQTVTGGAFAAVRDKAWHGLGVVVDHQVSARELLKLAKCDYRVEKAPLEASVRVQVGKMDDSPIYSYRNFAVPGLYTTYRIHPETGEFQSFGASMKEGYQVFQNDEVFVEWADALMQEAESTAATCGAIKDGAQAFMCFKLPRSVKVAGMDTTEMWLLAFTSHDASAPSTLAVTPLRTVCWNTCRWNLDRAIASWSLRHTKNARQNVANIKRDLQLTHEYIDEYEQVANSLLVPMSTNRFDTIITDLFAPPGDRNEWKKATAEAWDTKRGSLMRLWTQADTQAAIRHTAFAAVQTVGEFCDWGTKMVGADKMTPEVHAGKRFARSLFGEKSVTNPKRAILAAAREYASA